MRSDGAGRPPRAAWLAAAIACTVAACTAGPGVTSRSAQPLATDAPAATAPPTTPPAGTQPEGPATTAAPGTTAGRPAGVDPGSTPRGVGDELFPELGAPGVDVDDYHLRLAYDPDLDRIEAVVTIELVATDALTVLGLDAVGLEVHEVRVDGAPAPFRTDTSTLWIGLDEVVPPGTTVEAEVAYTATPDPQLSAAGIPNGWFHVDTDPPGSYVLAQPDGARTWVPSNDHPSDLATWTFEITVPAPLTAVANGELVEERAEAGERTTWVWRQDEPMPTYLLLLLTGDYEIVRADSPGGLPLLSTVLRGRVDLDGYHRRTGEQLAFFEQWFGPYPLTRYGLALTDSFSGLAMETMGRSMFSVDDLDGSLGELQELLLAHELAHQWFGNAVTVGRWRDIWLNESFATYAQWMWFEHLGWGTVESQAQGALSVRRAGGGPATGSPSVEDMFSYATYDGGAVVLHALRVEVGDEAFFELLRRWVADHVGTARTTDDFVALAEAVVGRSLGDLFDAWLFAEELPARYPGS